MGFKVIFLIGLCLCLLISRITVVLAGGYIIPHQTAKGLALSNAMIAGVDDPSAVYYNPAALSEIDGDDLLVNGTYINVNNSVQNSGRQANNTHKNNYLASLFANYHIPHTDLTAGIGTYSPFGLVTEYDSNFTRFAARSTELRTLFVTPAFSWQPTSYFSLGAGFSFVHSSAVLSRSLCFSPPPPAPPDPVTGTFGCTTPGGLLEGKIRITDTANAFTYNLGLLFKPIETVKLGFTYRGRTDLRFDNADVKLGGAFDTNRTKADVRPIPLPPVINAAVFWQITPSWGAEFVYEFTRWSEFKTVKASFSPVPNFVPLGPFGAVSSFNLPQDWKDTSTLRLGSFYRIHKNLELRGGIAIEQTPIPAKTLNPAIPGADILTLNAGLGYKWKSWSFDLGYQATFYKNRKVNNNELEGLPATGIPFLGAPGPDKYQTFINFVSIALSYRF